MAYIGVARPVIAKYKEREGAPEYSEGMKFGKAIKVGVSPNYEDVSDYNDINNTDDEEVFVDADVTLEISEIPQEAETLVMGHTMSGNEVTSKYTDRANYVGVGFKTREVISGQVTYIAIWIHKVRFSEEGQEHESKGDSVTYATPSVKGKAIPDINGEWRTKKIFESSDEADEWLNTIAGIERKER